MATITPKKDNNTLVIRTREKRPDEGGPTKWWRSQSKKELQDGFLGTVGFLKEQNQQRYRQANIYSRLYGNMPLSSYLGSNLTRSSTGPQLPIDRPTMSVITSCVDTLVSKMVQNRPRPVFLTDNGDYRQRNLAKQLTNFIAGEFYRTKAYELGAEILRDACVLGTGAIKVMRGQDDKVWFERVLNTELMVDPNEAIYKDPRQLYQLKLVDRAVLDEMFQGKGSVVDSAEQAFVDNSVEAGKTVSDLVMVAEGWHLKSGPNANDGRHVIACSSGLLLDEPYDRDCFPFVFLHYAPRLVGFWAQGLAERQMGTQIEINKLLMTISSAINLVGVPRVFVEDGSKVVKAHLNNSIGSIVTYRGTKPSYEVAPCVPVELYSQLQRLVDYAYQQEGISQLASSSMKPAGLNSGVAMREYNDIQSDRFAALSKRYDQLFIDLAYQNIEFAKFIAEETGTYTTVFPNKDGTREIDLPKMDILEDTYVIQCFDSSSLPREPAGRMQRVTEMLQAGFIGPEEGRRLLDYPDIEQVDKLANAGEERILKILDQIIEDGTYTPPDPFMNLEKAKELVVQYYNLYEGTKLEEEKAQLLRDFFSQVNALIQEASQPPPGAAPGGPVPQANPMAPPQSDMLPNVPGIPGA